MVDRNYSLPTLDKSEHHLLCMCMGSGSEWGERERERGRGVKYQNTSEVLATLNCKYMLGIFSFDVSCFTIQTIPLMYPDYTGKAHPFLDFFYADTLASHTLLASYPGLGTRLTRSIWYISISLNFSLLALVCVAIGNTRIYYRLIIDE